MNASQRDEFVAACCIASDHPCLAGHFPGRPIVPGVVVLDHVIAALEEAIGVGPGGLGPLRWPQVKFQQLLSPGQQAWIELTRIETPPAGSASDHQAGSERRTLSVAQEDQSRWRFRVRCGEQVIATGEVRQA